MVRRAYGSNESLHSDQSLPQNQANYTGGLKCRRDLVHSKDPLRLTSVWTASIAMKLGCGWSTGAIEGLPSCLQWSRQKISKPKDISMVPAHVTGATRLDIRQLTSLLYAIVVDSYHHRLSIDRLEGYMKRSRHIIYLALRPHPNLVLPSSTVTRFKHCPILTHHVFPHSGRRGVGRQPLFGRSRPKATRDSEIRRPHCPILRYGRLRGPRRCLARSKPSLLPCRG